MSVWPYTRVKKEYVLLKYNFNLVMKKMLIALAMVSLSATAFAQGYPTEKFSVATNSFWSNWFLSVHALDASYSIAGADQGLYKAPMWGGAVALGKWFTPGMGLRAKGTFGKFHNGEWLKAGKANHVKYYNVEADVLFNLSNLFCGYSESRVWNVIPYVSANFFHKYTHQTTDFGIGGGIISTWKLTKHLNLDIEASYKQIKGSEPVNLNPMNNNRVFALEAGLTFNLGKATWNKTPDIDAIMAANQSQLDALNAALSNAQAENARLKELLAQKPKETIVTKEVTKLATTPVSVFFNINRTKIASKKDLVNVEQLANYAKENNCNIVVTGYADSATGSVERNQKLSEGRAEAVKNALVDMGVDASKITTVAQGGVDTLSPISYNRRATVEIK